LEMVRFLDRKCFSIRINQETARRERIPLDARHKKLRSFV